MKKKYKLKNRKTTSKGALPRDTKVQKTTRLDLDVLGWVIQEGDRRGIPYQTLINSLLKEAMQRGGTEPSEASIHALAERLHRLELAVSKISVKAKIAI